MVTIHVETPHPTQAGKFQTLLRNSIELPDDLSFDYQTVINGIRLIYPNKTLFINFCVSSYGKK